MYSGLMHDWQVLDSLSLYARMYIADEYVWYLYAFVMYRLPQLKYCITVDTAAAGATAAVYII